MTGTHTRDLDFQRRLIAKYALQSPRADLSCGNPCAARALRRSARALPEAEKGPELHAVGAEMEKPAIDALTFAPIPYEGPRGVAAILAALEKHGWLAERETEGGPIIALTRGWASVTLEPGGQLELSGAVPNRARGGRRARGASTGARPHRQRSRPRALGLGFHPFATRAELPWVPKKRYAIMRDYLPTRGGRGLDMMLRLRRCRPISTSRANATPCQKCGCSSRWLRSSRRSSLTARLSKAGAAKRSQNVALFGSTSILIALGLLPRLFLPDASYTDYVEWALDVPMFLIKRGHEYLRNTGQTFRQF